MNVEAFIDTNLQGQKLGRKGRVTRERILAVTREIIEDPDAEPLSISAVARRAGLRQSSIYTYFPDFTELFLAVLEPVTDTSEEAYIGLARTYWPDAELEQKSAEFVQAFYDFWQKNARLLHLRNAISDQHEVKVARHRIDMARKVIALLGQQMGASTDDMTTPEFDLASVLFTGIERVVTVATDTKWQALYPDNLKPRFQGKTIKQQGRLLALAIADERARLARERPKTKVAVAG